ncbi:alpha/beta hydrolase [Streptomyces sp. NPDC026673]|uniref:alpha/beta hydrolase n=1 Tax=Streptomyces sp. NPDC026673 TaxID=3155724 RepID=UPI0033CE99B2
MTRSSRSAASAARSARAPPPRRSVRQCGTPRLRPRVGPVRRVLRATAVAPRPLAGARGQPARPVTAPGAAPILVVGTTRDPATPCSEARVLARQLSSGRLLTWEGDGHTAYLGAGDRVDDAVDPHLTLGRLPAAGMVCDGRPRPGLGGGSGSTLMPRGWRTRCAGGPRHYPPHRRRSPMSVPRAIA